MLNRLNQLSVVIVTLPTSQCRIMTHCEKHSLQSGVTLLSAVSLMTYLVAQYSVSARVMCN